MQSGISNSILPLFGNNKMLFFLFILWILVWKGLALWRASRKNQKYWFVALLILNTWGILEILYLFVFNDVDCIKKFPWFIWNKKKSEVAKKGN